MGILSRIRNSLSALSADRPPAPTQRYVSDRPKTSSYNLMGLKMAAETFSQPVWGPEISTVGAYSREGYTSKTFDKPWVDFATQRIALQTDEDVQLAVNDLASKITGGKHYWKAVDDQVSMYMNKLTKELQFDIMDTILVKGLLWYGNDVWKPRLGIQFVRSHDDLMQIPISSFVRIWWDRQRRPYKYEFRGPEYQGYHNPEDIIHLLWNPVNASVFGTGFGASLTAVHNFFQITPGGPQEAQLPSILDRKYSTMLTMHITERRYIPHNVYEMPDSTPDDRAAARADLQDLKPGEDFIVGTKTDVKELGSMQRAFNPTQWHDLVMAQLFKALNDFRGKQGGESTHSFANARTAALLDEIGLSSFPDAVLTQLVEKLFKPWYEANPLYSVNYGGGLVAMPWDEAKYELNFGEIEKKNLPPEIALHAIELGIKVGAIRDPVEIRDLIEDLGVGLRKEYANEVANEYHNTQQFPPGFEQEQPAYDFSANAGLATRPMDSKDYIDHYYSTPRWPPTDSQPSDPRLNFDEIKRLEFKKPSHR